MPLVLGIGMNKTGTSSLKHALETLGFPCLHNALLVKRTADANRRKHLPLLHPLDNRYDAFCDSPINYLFRELDAAYPGSRFILTVREMKPWIISRMAQFGGLPAEHRRKWREHVDSVMSHFAERPADLLVYDLCAGQVWEPLCKFLGVSIPAEPFPWANKTPENVRQRYARRLARISKETTEPA